MICLFVLNKSFCPLRAADCLFSQLGVDFEVVYFDKRSRRSKFNKLDRSKDEMTKKEMVLFGSRSIFAAQKILEFSVEKTHIEYVA